MLIGSPSSMEPVGNLCCAATGRIQWVKQVRQRMLLSYKDRICSCNAGDLKQRRRKEGTRRFPRKIYRPTLAQASSGYPDPGSTLSPGAMAPPPYGGS